MASMPPRAASPERRQNIADYRVTLDGDDLTARFRPRLVSLSLTEKRGGEADELEIVLDDDGTLAIPRLGAAIRLQLGWKQGADVIVGLVEKGRFTVDEASWSSAPDRITIRARSADLTAGFRQRRERSFRATTLGAVARTIATANNLQARVAPELESIAVPVLQQSQKSDMALLRELGRRHDAVATVKGGRLILSPIGKGATPSGRPIPAGTLTRASGDGYRYSRVDRSQSAGVEARWHDQDSATRKTVKVGGGTTGAPKRLRRTYHSEAEAKSAATAEARRMTRGAAEFEATLALGRPDLYPDRPMTLAGFKPEIDAKKWLIAEVTHSLDQGGLGTKLKLETAGK